MLDGTEDTSSYLAVVGYVFNELTAWNKELLQTLTLPQLVEKFQAFYGTQMSITVFASARHLSVSTARRIHFMLLHPTS